MAKNMKRENNWRINVVVSYPASPVSGDPVRFGPLTGVALTDEGGGGNAATETTVDFGPRSWLVSVKGLDDAGNSAVADGDAIYFVDEATPLSKKASGYFFGIARGTVSSGATTAITVDHVPMASNLSGVIGASDLTTTMRKGFIPLHLAAAREIGSNDIINTAGDAGVLSKDTTPILERINGATDKKQRIRWASSNNDEIAWDFPYPPDLDDAAAVIVNFIALSGGATDTPVLTVSYFEGIGDANAGGNTAALSAAAAQKTVSIAAGDVGAYPNGASVGLVPGAHTTDTVLLLAAWIEYTRK